ncbi:MAG: triacylglycerol lipase [Chitinophagaceae bacterium]|nr:triacylglycerol lipase [Oligoflexus sp.]
MKRFLLACLIVCAQFALSGSRVLGSEMLLKDYAEQGMIPPVVHPSQTEPRSLLGVADDVMVVNSDYLGTKPQTSTKYPIVLLHGFLGWDKVFFIDYFFHVRAALEADGFTVYTPQVNPVASIETRAKELGPLLDRILKETGAPKLNLIAHSMGGLDARYLIGHGYGDKIASLTTVGTPHHGTPVPNEVFGVLGTKSPLFKAFEFLAAGLIGQGGMKPADLSLKECLWNLSASFLEDYFNPNYPDDPNVYYQSYAGVSSITGFKTGDILDALLVPFIPAFRIGTRSDGLVPLESAHWGRFRGIVSADHVNLVGQLLGITSSRYDHVKFYKKIAWDLVDMGY